MMFYLEEVTMAGHALPMHHRVAMAACIAAVAACHKTAPPPSSPPPVEFGIPVTQVDTVSEQDVLTEGRKIFHGQGLCYGCHGGRLQGGPVAPALAGPRRNLVDTSFAHILQMIRAGEPHTPMVANQGGIDAGQVVQVANYVWAVSHGKSVP
jgi:mono/diheme cytochrome c family protein